MTVAVLALTEKLVDDVTSLEDDFEHLRETQQKLSASVARLDEKVSDFVLEYRKSMADVTETLTLQGALLERIMARLRGRTDAE